MESFNYIDGIVAAIIVVSALLAYGRGFVREAMAIAGWIAAAVLAYMFAPRAEPLIREIPGVSGIVGTSCDLSIIVAFALVFAIVLVLISLFIPLFASLVQRSALSGLDQGLGFVFGVLRGLLLVAIAFFVYSLVTSGEGVADIDESRSASVFGRYTAQVEEQDPQQALGWLTQQYQSLIDSCGE